MAKADLLLYLGQPLPPEEWRTLAGNLADQAGIRAIAPVAREGGRLLHVCYDPGQWSPSSVRETAHSLGFPARVAAL